MLTLAPDEMMARAQSILEPSPAKHMHRVLQFVAARALEQRHAQRALHETVAHVGIGACSQHGLYKISMATEGRLLQRRVTVPAQNVTQKHWGKAWGTHVSTASRSQPLSTKASCASACTTQNTLHHTTHYSADKPLANASKATPHLLIKICAMATWPPAAAFMSGVQPMSSLKPASSAHQPKFPRHSLRYT